MTAIAAQSHRAQPAPFGARCPVASLVALGFEFVSGFHDPAKCHRHGDWLSNLS
jgi:hypothetical protein